ncbi:hypothetical protein [Actinopolymorpha pittospori]|uniref:Uncharacterized protein n=1 Tax=Actinopolymorpha pittospori TaxID=648752 RepID=A0A927N7A5_9ACTN|nr:hypothetical protein [Actinopolymorpha pittospori]MBE1612323.1 hypothetical protein [Actinopolymorpha pittospori]
MVIPRDTEEGCLLLKHLLERVEVPVHDAGQMLRVEADDVTVAGAVREPASLPKVGEATTSAGGLQYLGNPRCHLFLLNIVVPAEALGVDHQDGRIGRKLFRLRPLE